MRLGAYELVMICLGHICKYRLLGSLFLPLTSLASLHMLAVVRVFHPSFQLLQPTPLFLDQSMRVSFEIVMYLTLDFIGAG